MSSNLAQWLFNPSGLTAHGFCLLWEPSLIWTYAVSDIGIGLAYFSIPLALAFVAHRRRDVIFRPLFWLFAAFILLCGTTHWLDLLTLWMPAYGVQALVKAATAVVSIVTAIMLWWLVPQAIALPSPAQLQDANLALHESETQHRARFELSPVPLYTMDGDEVITGVSDSFLSLLGYAKREVIGRHVSDFWARDGAATVERDRATLYDKGEIHDVERRFLNRDGTVIEGLVTARLEHQGDTTWVLCAFTNVTARRKAEAALRATRERLHQSLKMEAVGQLTGGIAHDFNNMLQGIAGNLELMERRIAQGRPEDAKKYVGAARQTVDKAASLTHRLLAFSRRQTLETGRVDPVELVRGMEELIRRTVGPEITLELKLREGVWNALSDANQMESALLNLAINARDAMPDGGTLTIETADRVFRRDELEGDDGAEPGDYVEISVTDTGAGMTQDVLARAFEPFFTTKPMGQGTGLGLSQIYGFIRQSGGFVRLDSEPGGGTSVRLYLPRHAMDSAPNVAAPFEQGGGSAGTVRGRVLVVEDEASVRAVMVDVLCDLGCDVLEAEDGPSGLRIVQSRERLDLLVTDVGLPGLNGRQLAEAARYRRPDMPVLLVTGYPGRAFDNMELPPGMEVLAKPFALDVLAARLRVLLKDTASG
jgi:PAS domain S-box-containing protein